MIRSRAASHSVDVGRHQPGLALAEDGVAGEDDPLLGHVDRQLAGGVPGVWISSKAWSPTRRVTSPVKTIGAVHVLLVLVAVGEDRRSLGVVGGDRLLGVLERIEIGPDHHEVVVDTLVGDHRVRRP